MKNLDTLEAVAFDVIGADVNLFFLEMMNRYGTYRANVAMLTLPTIINSLVEDCGKEIALEVVNRTLKSI